MEIILKKPTPGDIGWVISMHGQIYAQDFQLAPQLEIDVARKIVLFFDNASDFNLFLIPYVNGHRAGSIAVSKESEKTAFVNFVLVAHEFRGQGIARTMMHHIIKHSRNHNFKTVRLETYSCLTAARKLYKTLGFRLASSNKNVRKYGQNFDQEFWELKL